MGQLANIFGRPILYEIKKASLKYKEDSGLNAALMKFPEVAEWLISIDKKGIKFSDWVKGYE